MKENKRKLLVFGIGIIIGILLVIIGAIVKDLSDKLLSGVCFGIGAGLFGMSVGNLVTILIESKNPEAMRIKNIEVNDERNTAIRDKAGAKANHVMSAVLPMVTFIFALMNVDLL